MGSITVGGEQYYSGKWVVGSVTVGHGQTGIDQIDFDPNFSGFAII